MPPMSAKLTVCGAAGGVTGSCYHLALDGTAIVIDAGVFQGGREADELNVRPTPFDPATVDAMVLTHGHLDHVGRVPLLVERGMRGEVHAHPATGDIGLLIMEDTAKLGLRSDAPLYGRQAVEEVRGRIRRHDYRAPFDLGPFRVELFDAGHILGSAHVRVSWRTKAGERALLFSGDIGVVGTPIIRDPFTAWQPEHAVDAIVTESTYGDQPHPDRAEARARFGEVIRRALADGGKVLIPAFAIGRTQEILYELHRLVTDGEVAGKIPVIVDGPLSLSATEVYRRHRGCYDEAALELVAAGEHPLELDSFFAARGGKDSARIADIDGPAIIIAGSGMCNGGRIRGHLARYLPDPRTDVLLVGYQGARTLGRALEEGAQEVWLDGGQVPVRGRVTRLSGMSAHADQHGLAAWYERVPKKPGATTIVTHGEDGARATYARLLTDRFGARTVIPDLFDTIALD
jgi:metallo-beta-lactamase family protein